MTDTAHNEFDDLVRRAKGYHVRPLTPGEKAGVLWAESELTRLRLIEQRYGDVEGIKAQINKYIAGEMSNGYAYFRPIGCARAVRDYVIGEG